jgi:transposase
MLAEDLDVVSASIPTSTPTGRRRSAGPGAVLERLTPCPPTHAAMGGCSRSGSAVVTAGCGPSRGRAVSGRGLTTALLARGERVVDVDRAKRPARRAGVKSDDIDAIRAVRQAVADDAVAELRCRGEREAMRGLLATRAQAVEFRTRAICALHSLVTSAPDSP